MVGSLLQFLSGSRCSDAGEPSSAEGVEDKGGVRRKPVASFPPGVSSAPSTCQALSVSD
jgi:hypothetical protein